MNTLEERLTETPQLAARSHGCDILIADDSAPSREIVCVILRSFAPDLRLAEVRSGPAAVQSWQQLNPRITLLDLDMPGMDGFEVLQQLRALDARCFVAIVSAGSSPANVKRAVTMGANAFVVKPYKPQRILDVLTRYKAVSGVALA